jgi:putative spermidine/putrescine transport system ATP-binding protein
VDAAAGRLSLAGQEVRTARPVTSAAAGDRVTLAVRPEGIDLGEGPEGRNRLRGQVEDINFLGSIVRLRLALSDGSAGSAPTTLALDTFNEPHLTLPAVGEQVTISFPPEACFVLAATGGHTKPAQENQEAGATA